MVGEGLELLRNDDGFVRGAGGGEEHVGGESRTGAVSAPLVLEQALIGVDVFVRAGIGRTGSAGAVFGVGAVVVLRPESVENEGGVGGALGGVAVGLAELGGPGNIEEVIVEA